MAHNYSDELDDETFLALSKEDQEKVLEAERRKRDAEKLLFELDPPKDVSKGFTWDSDRDDF